MTLIDLIRLQIVSTIYWERLGEDSLKRETQGISLWSLYIKLKKVYWKREILILRSRILQGQFANTCRKNNTPCLYMMVSSKAGAHLHLTIIIGQILRVQKR